MIGAAPPLTAPWRATRSYTIRSSLRCTGIFQAMADVTARSSCCHARALFVSMEMGSSAHFGALRGNVVAIDFEYCGFAVQMQRVVTGGDFALLSWQQRKIIIRPENVRQILSALSLGDAQRRHEGTAAAGIPHEASDVRRAALPFLRGLNFNMEWRQCIRPPTLADLRW